MGIADLFGFGKKDKKPFRAPREVAALRTRIESELRENFPNIARYQEIVREAGLVHAMLNDIVLQKEYAEEAGRTQNELNKKLDTLTTKIKNNVREAKQESGQDYVENNMEYLERKNYRNKAKTLYTELLTLHERIMAYCSEGRQDSGRALESATAELTQISSSLNTHFFKVYSKDREIQGMRDQSLVKISGLIHTLEENNARLEVNGLAAAARTSALNLAEALKALSA